MKQFSLKILTLKSIRPWIYVLSMFLLSAQITMGCDWDYPIWMIRSSNADPLYRFIKDGKAGYIDQTGNVVIEPKFRFFGNHGGEFHDGLMTETGWEGPFYDTTGQIALDTKYFRTWEFSEGVAVAMQNDHEKWGYIDRSGRFVISQRFNSSLSDYVWPFSNGLALVKVSGLYGYIDHSGEFKIPPTLLMGLNFNNDLARIVADGPCLYVSESICPNVETLPSGYSRDLSACKYAFIDKSGNVISPERFERAGDFSEGLAPVRIGNKWGFIDSHGRHVIDPKFDGAWSFSDGLARIQQGRLYGFIDHNGFIVIPPIFEDVEDFSDGLAVVSQFNSKKVEWEKYRYIDKHGKQAIKQTFLVASSFYKGVAHVQLEKGDLSNSVNTVASEKYAYIDTKGKIIFTYDVNQTR